MARPVEGTEFKVNYFLCNLPGNNENRAQATVQTATYPELFRLDGNVKSRVRAAAEWFVCADGYGH